MTLFYHMPLYRPPSEADNLIIQATLGCGHNQCAFCSMYRSKTYEERPIEEVRAEIRDAARLWPEAHRVFLGDGDALRLPTDHLLTLLGDLAGVLPALARVSCYATPADILHKEPAELAALRAAKLSLLYMGVETGDADTLRRMVKGASTEAVGRAIERARAAGMKVSATVILGLAGRGRWREHAQATAALINRTPPTYLSTLQLHLTEERKESFLERFQGSFSFQDDGGMLDELEELLSHLAPRRPVIFRSNHASNALALAGTLPRDGDRLLGQLRHARAQGALLRPLWARGI
ncbi:radical SAM protein [Rhodospirillum rubrum]|uniref:radical SAM protein n=1 Tax=Rhodospirillum rubrum TaxID=1085 RepID=UPI0019086B5F|nr:radical SAM protein [Rhodospirillum rubrum]MBK1665838.1 radical SAM protein [Rhodospirillum rubrum]MBK1676825.1 radical SAM protein [Rhodospirillum rubrum]